MEPALEETAAKAATDGSSAGKTAAKGEPVRPSRAGHVETAKMWKTKSGLEEAPTS